MLPLHRTLVTSLLLSAGTLPAGAAQFIYAANTLSHSISAFSVQAGGGLTPVAGQPFQTTGGVRALASDPGGKYLYGVSADTSPGPVLAFSIDFISARPQRLGTPVSAGDM